MGQREDINKAINIIFDKHKWYDRVGDEAFWNGVDFVRKRSLKDANRLKELAEMWDATWRNILVKRRQR